jgi:murein DD-endopeptidase MepM/ murein hydrolase activator NlpD
MQSMEYGPSRCIFMVRGQPTVITMSAILKFLIVAIAVAAVFGTGCMQPGPAQQPVIEQQSAPVQQAVHGAAVLEVPFPPVPVPSGDGVNIAYEINLDPLPDQPVEKVVVKDGETGKILFTAEGEELSALYHPASVPPPAPAELQNGTGKLPRPRLSIWFVVSPGAVPSHITHEITLNRTANGTGVIHGPDVTVRTDLQPVVVGSPMKGPGWLAMETTSPYTHHFGAQITMDNVTRVPQRYAQDWVLVDPATGQAASGNATLARNYYGFGKEIHAVANGTVMAAGDGLPDNELIYAAPAATIETLAGNYVIVDIGNKKYACYAHMVNGSVRVKEGDVVTEGQVLGLMGNSGNSDIPHLHFQVVTDTPSFLGAEGYPHVYRSFEVIGSVNQTRAMERQSSPGYTVYQLWSEFARFADFSKEPVPQYGRLPENNAIVSFP